MMMTRLARKMRQRSAGVMTGVVGCIDGGMPPPPLPGTLTVPGVGRGMRIGVVWGNVVIAKAPRGHHRGGLGITLVQLESGRLYPLSESRISEFQWRQFRRSAARRTDAILPSRQ